MTSPSFSISPIALLLQMQQSYLRQQEGEHPNAAISHRTSEVAAPLLTSPSISNSNNDHHLYSHLNPSNNTDPQISNEQLLEENRLATPLLGVSEKTTEVARFTPSPLSTSSRPVPQALGLGGFNPAAPLCCLPGTTPPSQPSALKPETIPYSFPPDLGSFNSAALSLSLLGSKLPSQPSTLNPGTMPCSLSPDLESFSSVARPLSLSSNPDTSSYSSLGLPFFSSSSSSVNPRPTSDSAVRAPVKRERSSSTVDHSDEANIEEIDQTSTSSSSSSSQEKEKRARSASSSEPHTSRQKRLKVNHQESKRDSEMIDKTESKINSLSTPQREKRRQELIEKMIIWCTYCNPRLGPAEILNQLEDELNGSYIKRAQLNRILREYGCFNQKNRIKFAKAKRIGPKPDFDEIEKLELQLLHASFPSNEEILEMIHENPDEDSHSIAKLLQDKGFDFIRERRVKSCVVNCCFGNQENSELLKSLRKTQVWAEAMEEIKKHL
ncbi:MAG: hypothetical protein WAM28_01655 [Chlamydiales bacterium]